MSVKRSERRKRARRRWADLVSATCVPAVDGVKAQVTGEFVTAQSRNDVSKKGVLRSH